MRAWGNRSYIANVTTSGPSTVSSAGKWLWGIEACGYTNWFEELMEEFCLNNQFSIILVFALT